MTVHFLNFPIDKNEIDLIILDGDTLFSIEIKTSSDPTKSMISAFRCIQNIPGKKTGAGAVICLADKRLPLAENVWILPAHLI